MFYFIYVLHFFSTWMIVALHNFLFFSIFVSLLSFPVPVLPSNMLYTYKINLYLTQYDDTVG